MSAEAGSIPELPLAGVIGIGTDLLDSRRIEEAYRRHGGRFVRRILTPAERDIFSARGESLNFLAKQYAAKEALAKALGTGIADGVSFQHMEILRDAAGAPVVTLSARAAEIMIDLGSRQALLSLSDEGHLIQAFAVLV